MSTIAVPALEQVVVVIQEKPAGQWTLAWRRLRRHKLAMFGLVILTLVTLASIAAPLLAPYPYEEINLMRSYAPVLSSGDPGRPMHYLGTDRLGRDTLSRLLYAGRISLLVALSVTLLTVVCGAVVGALAGSFGGWIETGLMRFTDVMLTLPQLPLLLVLSSSLRQFTQLQAFLGSNTSVIIIILVLVIFGWMGVSRLVHGSVLTLRRQAAETRFRPVVMTALAWNLKAWWALSLPEQPRWRQRHQAQKQQVLRMEFRTFLNAFIKIPCQILRTGRRLVYRVLQYNIHLPVFFRLCTALRC